MPIKVYWDIQELLKAAAYLLASQEHMADVQEVYRQVFKKAAPCAIYESDRTWLLKRSNQAGNPTAKDKES